MNDDTGPYPKRDRQDTLQQLSLKAFQAILPTDKFLFRDERVDDKGVDGALEVVVNDTFRNCRAQVQLKSTDDGPEKFNKDGSYSLSVDTANLNYLMNGPCPMYVMWFSTANVFRYAWAHDEWQHLDREKPDWKEQDTFTIRLTNAMTPAVMDEIRDRILNVARMQRHVHENLARSAPAENVVVGINAKTLETTDPTELYQRLKDSGMTLVSAGYGKRVLEWFRLLNPGNAGEARIQLVAAFAQSSLGQHHAAIGHLGAAVIGRAALSEDDKQFLEYLRGACDYHIGKIDGAEYLRREQAWSERLTGVRGAEHRLEVQRLNRLPVKDVTERARLLGEMRETVDEILTAADAVEAQKIQARAMLLAAEGDDLNTQMIDDSGQVAMRQGMGMPTQSMARQAADDAIRRWNEWKAKADSILSDAVALEHPVLIADALSVRVTQHVSMLILERLNAIGQGNDQPPPQPVVEQLIRDAEQAIDVYKTAGNIEGELRLKMLEADLYDAAGDAAKAKPIAEEVLPVAEALAFERQASSARQHVEGNTTFQAFSSRMAARRPQDQDLLLAVEPDENLRSMARDLLRQLGAPADRIANAVIETFSMRQIARERVTWCRHLDLISDERPLQSPITAFREEPERICICKALSCESAIPHRDTDTVIGAFKQAYCNGCGLRSPLGPGLAGT